MTEKYDDVALLGPVLPEEYGVAAGLLALGAELLPAADELSSLRFRDPDGISVELKMT